MSDPYIEIDYIGGNCPVQSEGRIGGVEFYFRARHKGWSMGIGGSDNVLNPEFFYSGDHENAGWMPKYVALQLIADCIRRYVEGEMD